MLLGFKTELKINKTQRGLLAKHAGVARHAWNWGLNLTKQILDNNRTILDRKIKFPSAIDLHKWLVALLTLPRLKIRGFLVQQLNLPSQVFPPTKIEVESPQAFKSNISLDQLPICPIVAFLKMFNDAA